MKIVFNAIERMGSAASIMLPLGIVIGILFPGLADFLKAFLIPTLFISMTLALICTPSKEMIASFTNIKLLVGAIVWILVASPVLVWGILSLLDVRESLSIAVMFSVAAPPVTAAAAISIFLKLDSAISACVTVFSMLLVPLTLPLILKYLVKANVEISVWVLSFQLVLFILISFAVTLLLKRVLGEQKIANNKLRLNGISVVSISLFTIGIMSGVSEELINRPWFVIENLMASSLLVLGLYIVTSVIFWPAGTNSSMAIGIASGNCNLGLIYLVLVNKVDSEILMFFSIGQIPMYLLPTILTPLVLLLRQDH